MYISDLRVIKDIYVQFLAKQIIYYKNQKINMKGKGGRREEGGGRGGREEGGRREVTHHTCKENGERKSKRENEANRRGR